MGGEVSLWQLPVVCWRCTELTLLLVCRCSLVRKCRYCSLVGCANAAFVADAAAAWLLRSSCCYAAALLLWPCIQSPFPPASLHPPLLRTFVVSATMGICMYPKPPRLRGVLAHSTA